MVVDGKLKAFSARYTFHDFLSNYLVERIGSVWFEAEYGKPFEARHPIAQWHEKARQFHEKHRGRAAPTYSVALEGVVGHFLTLAHEVFSLQHAGLLEERLVARLLNKGNFQGARYELQVASICLRAGFEVRLEDETDLTSSHCEFSIRYPTTERSFSVEAKSRHRRGVLGRDGQVPPLEKLNPDVARHLEAALGKSAKHERIVFVDLNMPPIDGNLHDSQLVQMVIRQIETLEAKQTDQFAFPPAVLVFTNRPAHYVADDVLAPSAAFLMTGLNIPEFRASQCGPEGHEAGLRKNWPEMLALHRALTHQTDVPDKFSFDEAKD